MKLVDLCILDAELGTLDQSFHDLLPTLLPPRSCTHSIPHLHTAFSIRLPDIYNVPHYDTHITFDFLFLFCQLVLDTLYYCKLFGTRLWT